MLNGTLNPAIVKLLIGKTEQDAISTLEGFQRKWRVYARDGAVFGSPIDRDDSRYGLVIDQGIVTRVMTG